MTLLSHLGYNKNVLEIGALVLKVLHFYVICKTSGKVR